MFLYRGGGVYYSYIAGQIFCEDNLTTVGVGMHLSPYSHLPVCVRGGGVYSCYIAWSPRGERAKGKTVFKKMCSLFNRVPF